MFIGIPTIGILCRGKSLQMLPEYKDKFEHCFIVNNFCLEYKNVSINKVLRTKKIIQFINADYSSVTPEKIRKQLLVDTALFTWTCKHLQGGMGKPNVKKAVDLYSQWFKTFHFLPDTYYTKCNEIRNSGVLLSDFVAHEMKAKDIWIFGLDFYSTNYMVDPRTTEQLLGIEHGLIERLANYFINVVKTNVETTFHVITYYKYLPTFQNLEVIKV